MVEAEAPETGPRKAKLTDHEWSFLKEIKELYAREGATELAAPEPGMPVMRVVRRTVLRDWLVSRGKLSVTEGVTHLGNAERQRLFKVLNALRDKGFIEMNADRVWVLG